MNFMEEICREAAANAEDANQKPQPVPEGWTERVASRPAQGTPLHQSNIAGLKSTVCRCIFRGGE